MLNPPCGAFKRDETGNPNYDPDPLNHAGPWTEHISGTAVRTLRCSCGFQAVAGPKIRISPFVTEVTSEPKTLWLVQKPDGKIRAYLTKPAVVDGLQLAITYHGQIVGVTHGGFFSVPIEEKE